MLLNGRKIAFNGKPNEMVAINSSQALSLLLWVWEKGTKWKLSHSKLLFIDFYSPLFLLSSEKKSFSSSSMVSWKDSEFQRILKIHIEVTFLQKSLSIIYPSKNNFYFHLTSSAISKLHKQQKMLQTTHWKTFHLITS